MIMNLFNQPWTVLSVALAAIAVLAGIRGPHSRIAPLLRASAESGNLGPREADPDGRRSSEIRRFDVLWRRLAELTAARADALPRSRRLVVSAVSGLAIGLSLPNLVPALSGWSWVLATLAAGVLFVILGRLEPAAARRRNLQLIMETPQLLDLLAACLAAGLPLRRASKEVAAVFAGPLADDLEPVLSGIALGLDDASAWRSLRDHRQLGRVAVDLARSVESGSMMVEVLRHHARYARQARQAELQAEAKRVGVRCVVPLMACFIPAFLCIGVVPTIGSAVFAILN